MNRLLSLGGFLAPVLKNPSNNPNFVIIREHSRLSTRLKRNAEKARRKALAASLPPPPRKLTFEQRLSKMFDRGAKSAEPTKTVSTAWPSRLLKVEVENTEKPVDDVFRLSYSDEILSISEAVETLRELNHPTVYDDPAAPLTLRLDLNMNLDIEAQEYVESGRHMLVLPYPFEYGKKRVIMAFTKNVDAQMASREAGAEFAGGTDEIRKIRKGEFKVDDVDYFVANVDLMQELAAIRGLLGDKFPTERNGLLGVDVIPLVKHFRHAISFEMKRDEEKPDWGVCSTVLGRLNMPLDQIEANVAYFMTKICDHRPLAASLGHFIYRSTFVMPERKLHLQVDFTPFVPSVPDDDAALQAMVDPETGKKRKRKKKK